jgi:hypothetical protein
MPVRSRRFEQFKPFFTGCDEDHMIEKLPLWEALYEWCARRSAASHPIII